MGWQWERRVGYRHDQDTLSTRKELSKKYKNAFVKSCFFHKWAWTRGWTQCRGIPCKGFSCLLWCFHAGFSILSLRPASCTPTILVSLPQPSWGLCAHWRDFLISLPVLTWLHGMSQLLFSVHSRFSLLSSFPSCQPWLSHPLLWFALHMSGAGFQAWTSTSQLSPKA